MRVPRIACLVLMLPVWSLSQTPEVGSGAPSAVVRRQFEDAFIRRGFNLLVSLPPVGHVQRYGTTGLIQEFRGAEDTSARLALIRATTSDAVTTGDDGPGYNVFQVRAAMYAYYKTIGVSTAGYPTQDTANCPPLYSSNCQYQFFSLNYVLFTYAEATFEGQNFYVREPFFSKWNGLGGLSELGGAITGEQSVTSRTGITARMQRYQSGVIYQITSGTLNGRVLGVKPPVYDLYVQYGRHEGLLGLPSSEELTQPGGRRRQNFEGGAIEYSPGGGAVLRRPVASVAVAPNTLRLNQGETATLTAVVTATDGSELTDRVVAWTTSNGRVVTVQVVSNGLTATVKAVGGGTAVITATSEGKTSPPVAVSVTAPCCQVGEGAPSAALQQAFQDVVTRNRLSIRLPVPGPVRRLGSGYVQDVYGADSGTRYLLTKSDRSPAACFVTGDILQRFEQLGGPAGSLGYPAADPTASGRQLFENSAALAGSPVRLVASPILGKWATLGYETGAAGPPTADAASFLTFTGTAGVYQAFREGELFAGQLGPQANRAWLVRGLILARFASLGRASGILGMPTNDEFSSENRRRQDFEGGWIDYAAGDAEATVHERERRPAVSAAPGVVTAGGRVRLTVSGFSAGARLRVAVSGRPDFEVTAATGAYSWEVYVPSSAAAGTVSVRATDLRTAQTAETTYQVRTAAETRFQLAKQRGDAQTGAPGALLPKPLRVSLRDEGGNPVAGVTVRFTASPGAQVAPSSALTDENGEAETALRLPPFEGAALATAEAARQVVTFSALAARTGLTSFPGFRQSGDSTLGPGPGTLAQKGALLHAVASILRYHQNRSELASPQGLAEPAALNRFLSSLCQFDTRGAQLCDGFLTAPGSGEPVVNLWRLAAFVGGDLTVSTEPAELDTVRDLLVQGSPALLGLALQAGGAPAGSHFVVAVGVGADGGILVHDPSPVFGRATLGEYLGGFTAGTESWKGTLASVIRLAPGVPPASAFVVTGAAEVALTSAAGACGRAFEWPDIPAPADRAPGVFRARACDGTQAAYQLEVLAQSNYQLLVTDLASAGSRFEITGAGPSAFRLARPAGLLTVAPQQLTLATPAVLNAASQTAAIAPGALVTIFGGGLARAGAETSVEIGGLPATLISATSFQLNVQVPLDLSPGAHKLVVRSPYGAAEQPLELQECAPAVFVLAGRRAAVLNQDGQLNAPTNPAPRGQALVIYGTGLGAVTGTVPATVRQPVTALLQGMELTAAFAGLAPGFPGLYQVNLLLPAGLPPGLEVPLALKQAGAASNAVPVSIH